MHVLSSRSVPVGVGTAGGSRSVRNVQTASGNPAFTPGEQRKKQYENVTVRLRFGVKISLEFHDREIMSPSTRVVHKQANVRFLLLLGFLGS